MTRWFAVSIALAVAALGASLYIWAFQYDALPERVPTHWNLAGQPDAWTPKADVFSTFLLLPAVMGGMLVLTLLLPWLSPKAFEVDRFRGTWDYVMMLVQGLLGYLHVVILWASMRADGGVLLTNLLIGGIFLFFALMGNVMGQVRRNFWMGVRTPWTLASEEVWNRTHRLAGWLWLAGGLAGFVAVLAGVPFWACFIGLMAVALYPVLYSLVLYKRLQAQGKV